MGERAVEERRPIARETCGREPTTEQVRSLGSRIAAVAPLDEAGVLRIGHAFEQAARRFERPPAGR